MSQLSLLDFVLAKLRFWRPAPPGVPTLAELWSQAGSAETSPGPEVTIATRSPRSDRVRGRMRLATGPGPFPLGLASAFVLLLVARTLLVGADPATAVAVVLAIGAVGCIGFAVRRGEIPDSVRAPAFDVGAAEPGIRPVLLAAALAAGGIAGFAARGNHLGPGVVIAWFAAVVLMVVALGVGARPFRWPRLADSLRGWTPGGMTVAVAALTVLAAGVRWIELGSVPAEMTSVHAELLTAIRAVGTSDALIVTPSSAGGWYPIPVVVTAAIAPLVGGMSFLALKVGTLLAGVAAIPFIYLLGRELAGRAAGLCAAALAAVGSWPDLVSRLGLPAGWYPAVVAAALAFLVRALRRGRRADFVGVGVCVGLAMLCHSMARSLLAAVVVILIVGIAAAPSRRRRLSAGLAIVVVAALITGLPALEAAPDPEPAMGPLWWLGAAVGERDTSVGEGLVERTERVLALPVMSDGGAWSHGGTGRPALDAVAGALFGLGLVLAVVVAATARRLDLVALVVALPLLMLPAIAAPLRPEFAPSLVRCAGALAPVFAMAGIGLAAVAGGLRSSIAGRTGRWLASIAAVALVAASAAASHAVVHTKFVDAWDGGTWNASELGAVVRSAITVGVPPDRIHIVPHPHWVDTRLVAFEAGLAGVDLTIDPDRLDAAAGRGGPHLFLVHPDDEASLAVLRRRLPNATVTTHPSRVPGRTFVSVLALGAAETH